ncbi:6-phosphofructokinase [Celerinatantimonas diazotrophica]|uniref:6-phosphofructokinase n=1 Tax=Celerinatantimonas diazotrophica TaxID=412034 RepID=A0A4R1K3W5_9GAMM|nr:6-phosphofructokinase [Celerinatantimonas diazotrophica]TCK58597.1 6-phosphofructokinase 1 [Celerinatantimonas diazotrophica]CAG9297226.1 ATP-dependent 6-phosphofructokinase isozyme 1 [Celerinatantimonas diazotrophica]
MKIGIVISGGDGAGINNFIFQVARLSGADITIFNGGIHGLLNGSKIDISYRDLIDYSISSMPIISSGRSERYLNPKEYDLIASRLKKEKISVLILAGGDGSMKFLHQLSQYGVNCFGVGMTVDNDLAGSEYTIGFSTACEEVLHEVTKLRNTGRALPNRVFLVEVLGAYCGELTLQSAIKSNADFALIPEYIIPTEELANRVNNKLAIQNSVIILCAESYTHEYTPGFQGAIDTVAEQLEPLIGIRIRKTTLGFGLRNGNPTTEEIYQGTIAASEVVRCIKSGMTNKVIVINASNKPIPVNLNTMQNRIIDKEGHYFKLAKQLEII